ncbi:MAG TPA: hypothetical protein VG650_01740 [Mycobacteriales bacterium]|nr:hypothetical protein [Mycobacteriales bacterium]
MSGQPRGVETELRQEFEALVAIAGRAPSVHNTQPWRFGLSAARTLELELVRDRVLPHTDPTGREAVVSCGAALHNLLLALRMRNLRGTVVPAPDADRPLVLASVTVEAWSAPTESERRAFASIFRRHTHRSGFDAPVADASLRDQLTRAASLEGCTLLWVTDPATREGVIGISHAAVAQERTTAVTARETDAWQGADGRRDGVPSWAVAPRRPIDDRVDRLPDRFLSDRRLAVDPATPGTLAVLVTSGDGMTDWLAAGQGLQRMLLRAAEDWAFAALSTSALETPRFREAVRSILGTADYPQAILELGHSSHTLTTARLDAGDLIATTDA